MTLGKTLLVAKNEREKRPSHEERRKEETSCKIMPHVGLLIKGQDGGHLSKQERRKPWSLGLW